MKVKTNTKIDVARPAHLAYTALLETAYQEYLARKADATSDPAGDDAASEFKKDKTAAG